MTSFKAFKFNINVFKGILRNLFGVTNADSNTIFSHYTNPTSANNYFRAAFTPDIFGEADYSSQILETCTVGKCIHSQGTFLVKVKRLAHFYVKVTAYSAI